MCVCTPSIRTPYCLRGNCFPPGHKPENARIDSVASMAQSIVGLLDENRRLVTELNRVKSQLDAAQKELREEVYYKERGECCFGGPMGIGCHC